MFWLQAIWRDFRILWKVWGTDSAVIRFGLLRNHNHGQVVESVHSYTLARSLCCLCQLSHPWTGSSQISWSTVIICALIFSHITSNHFQLQHTYFSNNFVWFAHCGVQCFFSSLCFIVMLFLFAFSGEIVFFACKSLFCPVILLLPTLLTSNYYKSYCLRVIIVYTFIAMYCSIICHTFSYLSFEEINNIKIKNKNKICRNSVYMDILA